MKENFKNGDKVYLTGNYAGDDTTRYTISEWNDDEKRGWIGDKDGLGWYAYDYMITHKKPANKNQW